MNILILNLARFGDLLQTQAAIKGLVGSGHRVGVVCLDNFAEAAGLLSGVSHLAVVPARTFLGMDAAECAGQADWRRALASLDAWRENLYASFVPDKVCNLIPNLSSRLFAAFLAKGRPCGGFAVDGYGFGLNTTPWASLLYGSSQSRGVSPFNIVDVFRRIAEEGSVPLSPGDNGLSAPPEELIAAAGEYLRANLPEGAGGYRGFVALQLGASQDRRRWPVAFFAGLGDILWKEGGFCPVLLGSKAEMPLAARYGQTARHPFVDMCGKTGLAELAAVLKNTAMLVSNDTGTMHLASGLGAPVLAIFLATAQPFDTGPYLAGSCSLEPALSCHPCSFGQECGHDLRCRQAVPPEFVASLALSRLEQGDWRMPPRLEGAGASPARVWLSARDEQGMISLRSLSGHGAEGRTLWLELQRHYLRQFLDRGQGAGAFLPRDAALAAPLPCDMREEITQGLERALTFLEVFSQQGRVLMQKPLPLMRERFLVSWRKVAEALDGSQTLKALCVLWNQETQAPGLELDRVMTLAEDFSHLFSRLLKAAGKQERE